MTTADTYTATIYIAGDAGTARMWLRRECYESGLCVTVTPTTFIYTGGEEAGVAIGFVNYSRFPSTPEQIWYRARDIAERLITAMCQKSCLVVGSDRTEWISKNPPGAR